MWTLQDPRTRVQAGCFGSVAYRSLLRRRLRRRELPLCPRLPRRDGWFLTNCCAVFLSLLVQSSNRALCAKYDVKGFPTIKAFTRGGKIPPKDYQGERKAGPLTTYASQAISDRVKKLRVPSKGGVDAEDAKKEVESFLKQVRVLAVHQT